MTSRERMLTALNNGRPDRLPCQVHGWMNYYLNKFLGGMDWWQAYEKFDMDYAIYVSPNYSYSEKDLANWQRKKLSLGLMKMETICGQKLFLLQKVSLIIKELGTKLLNGLPITLLKIKKILSYGTSFFLFQKV